MMDTFKDKVVLITGAGRGVGRALALGFAREGAIVAANDLTPANLDKTLETIKVTGGNARSYLADVAKSMPVRSMIKQIQDDWGTLDVVVNNAAVAPRAPILEMDEWDWQRTLDVNLSGPFWLAQAAGQAMEALGEGVMLNLIAQPDWLLGLHQQAAYLATQYGLIGLTLAIARELAPLHVRVNGLLVGSIDSSSVGEDVGDAPRQLNGARPGTGVPMAKVVEQALYLCSPAASELSGQIMAIGKGAK
jgi:3-oxoacyl-[acyl-carrier protein] reductase